jgi:hypothetical protein
MLPLATSIIHLEAIDSSKKDKAQQTKHDTPEQVHCKVQPSHQLQH